MSQAMRKENQAMRKENHARKQKQPFGPFVLWTPDEGGTYRKSWEAGADGQETTRLGGDLAEFALLSHFAAAGLPCPADVRVADQEASHVD